MAERISVKKTYKLYVGGKFPRSESGATLAVKDRKGNVIASCCKASRKDFRDAVLAAASGAKAWKKATPYLRGQILYRAAEMLEGRSAQFVEELQLQGLSKSAARKEVQSSIDRLIYYAGWTDKAVQLFSSVNPVASPHFCFTVPEPTGVIAILLGEGVGFSELTEAVGRVLAGGNSAILVSGNTIPLTASTMGEVWQTSDLPAGVLNILTGPVSDLSSTVSSHRSVDGILGVGLEAELEKSIQEAASDSLKRLRFEAAGIPEGSPYAIQDFLEMKTTWHPVGV
ncbi:aldehyde dehydrogenase [Puniceicoccales bacterium CK1056]|uniref:Aldehyde dehydrogenase n=1 Tax=Oceanipulchritudo coccoides TaxID=2706888 RepID=A0A6B2M3R1_9BACT|nr:aldehyde dehydrogenase family protein [Oceanipulchritudo coccoides]NDV62727.1 aldehyde dehydrogenase [Oceanipulchritudo coccoides]